MSAGAAERDLTPPGREKLRQAARRLREAHEGYERFLAVTPLGNHDVVPHLLEDMKAAQKEIDAAEQEYARLLREDPDFSKKSRDAEKRLTEGPPWDDEIQPSDLLSEGGSADR